ncbi:N-acetylmuramate alpha-1-phosphate uridylyltransferase MurU [Aliiglaciecola litoralis]|uniref:Nucleotidyltransferase family protein n=1 Tax=Aliiglaciecola litoralis TaxID=582857 RepID=A0ABN1LQP4_9ALTE
MKVAMILAAGRGERMRPLTDHTPKPLLEVQGKPLIHHHLINLEKAGYKKVIINHAWLGQQLVDALGDGSQFGLSIVFSAESEALETAGGIINALPLIKAHLADSHCFTVVNGDIFTDMDFAILPTRLDQDLAHLVLVDNPAHNPTGDFCLNNGRIERQPRNQFTFSGVAVYHVDMFNTLFSQPQTSPIMPLAPLLFQHAADNRLSGALHQGYWFDVGTPERLAQLNQMEVK